MLMLNRLRAVLRESYVGHVMCAVFILSALQFTANAIDDPLSNLAVHFYNLHTSAFPEHEPGVVPALIAYNLLGAAVCLVVALVFGLWVFRIERRLA